MTHDKVAIVGAGAVGATIAYACGVRGAAGRVTLYDRDGAKAAAEASDLAQGLADVPGIQVEGSDDLASCAGAAVVVVTIGARERPGQTPAERAATHAAAYRELIPRLVATCPEAVFLIVSNPADVITHVAQQVSGLPAGRVLGPGTVLASAQFRLAIARRLRVAPAEVRALVAGGPGESAVPLWSSATVGGVPLHQWAVAGHGRMSVMDRAAIAEGIKDAAREIVARKGAAPYGLGLAAAEIVEAILRDEGRVLPVSALVTGYAAEPACMSVPRIVGRAGAGPAVPVPLNDNETAGLRNYAEATVGAARGVGL